MVYHQLFNSRGSQINYPHNVVPASLMLENTISSDRYFRSSSKPKLCAWHCIDT